MDLHGNIHTTIVIYAYGYIYVNTLYTEAKKARIKFTGEKTNNHNPQRPRSYIRDTHIQQLLRSMHYC